MSLAQVLRPYGCLEAETRAKPSQHWKPEFSPLFPDLPRVGCTHFWIPFSGARVLASEGPTLAAVQPVAFADQVPRQFSLNSVASIFRVSLDPNHLPRRRSSKSP